MDDATQMLRISIEGMKFVFEATRESIEMMTKFLMVLKSSMIKTGAMGIGAVKEGVKAGQFLKYRKNAGKTNRSNFNVKSGGAGIGYAIDAESYKYFKQTSKKAGLLYYEMASFKSDDRVHIMIPKEGVTNFQAAMELAEKEMAKKKRKSQNSKENGISLEYVQESVEDYLKDQGLDQMDIEEVAEKCREGMTEEQKKEFDTFAANMGKKFEEKSRKEEPLNRTEQTEKKTEEVAKAVKNNEATKQQKSGQTKSAEKEKEQPAWNKKKADSSWNNDNLVSRDYTPQQMNELERQLNGVTTPAQPKKSAPRSR